MSGKRPTVFGEVAAGYLRLRLLVGNAGEQCETPWWHSGFGTRAGQRFLRDRLFARTFSGGMIHCLSTPAPARFEQPRREGQKKGWPAIAGQPLQRLPRDIGPTA